MTECKKNNNTLKREKELSGLFIASCVLEIFKLIREIFTRYFSRDPQSGYVWFFFKFCRDADLTGLFPFKTNAIPRHYLRNSAFFLWRILISTFIFSDCSNRAFEIRDEKKESETSTMQGDIFAKKKKKNWQRLKTEISFFLFSFVVHLSYVHFLST